MEKNLHPLLEEHLKYDTKLNRIYTKEPSINSRASYLLLRQELTVSSILPWLIYREDFLDQFEVLTCCKCGESHLKKKIDDNKDKEQLKILATVDHIKPLSKGGKKFSYDNMQVMCHNCNNRKGNKYTG
jgi:5-methylcytosine-specific restriction endonuclease McrA